MASQTYEEFEKEYKLIREFGVKALQNKLNLEMKQQGQTAQLGQQNVLDLVHSVIRSPEINNRLDHAFEIDLNKARLLLEQKQTPRADNRPEVTNRNILNTDPNQKPTNTAKSLKNPPWTAKMDLSADPKVQDAINNIAQNPNMDKAELTTQFNQVMNALENKLKNEYANRLKMAGPKPTPGKKVRPEPF